MVVPVAAAQSGGMASSATLDVLHYECSYLRTADDLWWARCIDSNALAQAFLAQTTPSRPSAWDIPLYAMPFSDADSVYLVRSVLCRGRPCSVSFTPGRSLL
ncbi:MAG: hypothetical protein ACK4N4_04320 [Burkholderiales bacterium]